MIRSGNLSSLTPEALREMAEAFRPGPQCLVVFEWTMAPPDKALKFSVPEANAETLRWLGPYAVDILQALSGARNGDYVLLVHPVTIRLLFPPPTDPVYTTLAGIPVRELRRDEKWMEEAAAQLREDLWNLSTSWGPASGLLNGGGSHG